MSWRTDKIVEACEVLEGELPRAKRALVAARRSGRDKMFNAYIAVRRLKLEVVGPVSRALDTLSRN